MSPPEIRRLNNVVDQLHGELGRETVFFDTCGLNFSPWDTDPYNDYFSWRITPVHVELPKKVSWRGIGLLKSLNNNGREEDKAKVSPGVYEEVAEFTSIIDDHYRRMREDSLSDEAVAIARDVRRQRRWYDREVQNCTAKPCQPIARNCLRSDVGEQHYRENTTDIRLVGAAADYAVEQDQPTTIVTADKDIPAFLQRLYGMDGGDRYYDTNIDVAFIKKSGNVVKTSDYGKLPSSSRIT